MRHVNIPVFIPHLGCPNLCVFCNQRSISGKLEADESTVAERAKLEIETALSTVGDGCETEIAFFGGSFTGIGRGLMIKLLDIADSFCKSGKVSYIRMSTRPDYISGEILDILSRYPVKYIELGIQSMSDEVLLACKRGHTAMQSRTACRLVKEYGFSLIGQMMTGLPRSSPEDEIMTADEIISLGADGARIYPTMIFRRTELEQMALRGEYAPPGLENSVKRTAAVLRRFTDAGVPVIKIGLHSGESLYADEGITISEYHPAMGELVTGEVVYGIVCEKLDSMAVRGGKITVTVPEGMTSKAIGHRGRNKKRLIEKYSLSDVSVVESDGLHGYEIEVQTGQE